MFAILVVDLSDWAAYRLLSAVRFHLEVQLSRAPGANSCSRKKFTATHSRRLLMSWMRSLAATSL